MIDFAGETPASPIHASPRAVAMSTDQHRGIPVRALQGLVVLAAAIVFGVLRDVRVPVDGCAYACQARDLLAGAEGPFLVWSHLLHVPVLALVHRLVGLVASVDLLAVYQGLDIVCGAVGLGLVFSLCLRLSGRRLASLAACLLVMVSWVYWLESTTADEKMPGFVLVLAYLVLLLRYVEDGARGGPILRPALALSLTLSAAILLHVSAVLVVPMSLYLGLARRRRRLVAATAAITASITVAAYLLAAALQGVSSVADVRDFFATGTSTYSVFTNYPVSPRLALAYAQGLTKLVCTVFAHGDPGLRVAIAGVNVLLIGGLTLWLWRRRASILHRALLVLLGTSLLFGLTYAPDCPDSYFLMIVPLGMAFAGALAGPRARVALLAALVLLVVNNGRHYLAFSSFRAERTEAAYAAAIDEGLGEGDVLIYLDSRAASEDRTLPLASLHAYFQPGRELVPYSEFARDPLRGDLLAAAAAGRLFIEGLCFEDGANVASRDVSGNARYRDLARLYDLEVAVPFGAYSSVHHRTYKDIHGLTPNQ